MKRASIGQNDAALPVEIHRRPAALGDALADRLLHNIAVADASYLLGCPGGRSGRPVYQAMGRIAAEREIDLSRLVIVMMDDYAEPASEGFGNCPIDAHYSCRRFAYDEIRDVLNAGLPIDHQVLHESIWTPDAADPAAYEQRIADAGGIDLFILASGASDGHVAFNPPGSPIDSTTRIVDIAEATRRDNLQTFPDFRSIDEVPTHGVSVGIGTIIRHSRSAALVMHGEHKRESVRRLNRCNGYDPQWPVSCVFACREATVYLDEAAAGQELEP